jgi:mevalonate kinase
MKLEGLRTETSKLVVKTKNNHSQEAFYNLSKDPEEKVNLLEDTKPEDYEKLKQKLKSVKESLEVAGDTNKTEELGEAMKGRLKDLGYL